MSRFYRYLFCAFNALCVLMFSGVSFAVVPDQKAIEERTQGVYRLLLAELANQQDLFDFSQPLFLSLAQDWDNVYLLEKGTDAALATNNFEDTYLLADRWTSLDKTSSRAREMKGIAAWLKGDTNVQPVLKDALLGADRPDALMIQWIKGMTKLPVGINGIKKDASDSLNSRYELLREVAAAFTTRAIQLAVQKKPTQKKQGKHSQQPKDMGNQKVVFDSGKIQLSLAVFSFQLQRFDDAKKHALQAWQQLKQDDILAKDIGSLLSKDSQEQKRFFESYLASNTNSVLARCMLGLSSVDARDFVEAHRLLSPLSKLIEQISPEQQEALGTLPKFTLAVYLTLQNRHDAARIYFNDYLNTLEKLNTKDPEIIERMVFAKNNLLRGFIAQKNASAAESVLNQIHSLKPELAQQKSIEKIKLLGLTQGVEPALKQIKQWEERSQRASSAVVAEPVLNNKAAKRMTLDLYHYLETSELGLDTINYWFAQNNQQRDDDVFLMRELAYFKDKQLKSSEAIVILNQLHQKHPDNADIWNDLAYLLVNYSLDLSRAARLTHKAYKNDPNNPAIIDTLGWLSYRQADKKTALKKIQLAYDLFFDSEVALHLYELLLANNQGKKAILVFDEFARERPDQLYRLEMLKLQKSTIQQIKANNADKKNKRKAAVSRAKKGMR